MALFPAKNIHQIIWFCKLFQHLNFYLHLITLIKLYLPYQQLLCNVNKSESLTDNQKTFLL